MKTIILLLYIVVSYMLIPYLFSFLGAIKKVGTMPQEELNDKEVEQNQLDAGETAQVQTVASIIFLIIGMYLYAILGVVFGFSVQNLVGNSTLKWVAYPFFYIMMVSSFRMGRKVMEQMYDTELSIMEQVVFYLAMLVAYLMAIWAKDSLPIIFTWFWVY